MRTNRLTLLAVFASILFTANLSMAGAISQPSRPDQISEENWISLSDRVGFVITGHENKKVGKKEISGNQIPIVAKSARGYFMVRHKNVWIRLKTD